MMERKGWAWRKCGVNWLAKADWPVCRHRGGDVRDLEASPAEAARLALAVFSYQVKKTIGAYAAAMGGLDAVAFTGGIGENSAALRAACCEGLDFLGVRLDSEQNENGRGDRLVSRPGRRCPSWRWLRTRSLS